MGNCELWATVYYGQLWITQNQKRRAELGLSFGTGYYNNLFENFEIFLNFGDVIWNLKLNYHLTID